MPPAPFPVIMKVYAKICKIVHDAKERNQPYFYPPYWQKYKIKGRPYCDRVRNPATIWTFIKGVNTFKKVYTSVYECCYNSCLYQSVTSVVRLVSGIICVRPCVAKCKKLKKNKTEQSIPATFLNEAGQRIYVRKEDITKMKVDVIVNAANEHLRHNGGVALAISRAAGPGLQQECVKYVTDNGPLDVGGATVTQGYGLPSRYVVHVVGPRWQQNKARLCKRQLKEAFKNCLYTADTLGNISSIAIPAISSGIFGAPQNVVIDVMCESVLEFCRSRSSSVIRDIYLVDINEKIPEQIARYLRDSGKVSDETPRPTRRTRKLKKGSASFLDAPFENKKIQIDTPTTLSGTSMETPTTSYGLTMDTPTTSCAISMDTPTTSCAISMDTPTTSCAISMDTLTMSCAISMDTPTLYTDISMTTPAISCAICLETPTDPQNLSCGHVFCDECISQWMEEKPTCPCCGKVFGTLTGNQPDGTMRDRAIDASLPGHEGWGTIQIEYRFESGIQELNHPKPGSYYQGTRRVAYLPDSLEGREVLALLRKAFDARLLFTIGRSVTTGRDDQVTWNDVHHKTSMSGGPQRFGYPDPGYLVRVKEELAAKGIC